MRVLKNKKIVSAVTAIFIFLVSCSIFSLMSTTSILSNETTEIDDSKNTLRSSALSPVFDGMYVNYIFSEGPTYFTTNFSYSHVSGSLFNQTWNLGGMGEATWLVDIQTRIISGSFGFVDGSHDPVWIFTNASLGDTIPISVDGVGDHSFLVSDDLVYDLPSYGPIDVWELEDLTFPGGVAWYEKSTGLLINGTFFYLDLGTHNYTFSFMETNVEFTYYEPPSLTVTNPDSISLWETGTSHSITWTSTGAISDVKIELYRGGVFEMEIVASTTNDGSYSWTIPSGLADSTLYQIRISDVSNPATYDDSDNFEIFTTVVLDGITVTNPDSISVWGTGTTHSITWTSTGSITDVKIELYKGGVFEMEIIASTANDGTYNWDIPTDLTDRIDYYIRISDVSNPATYDDSDNFEIFTTVVLDGITVTNPDSISVWGTGTTHSITWTSTGSITDVKIELYKGGVLLMEIVASTHNDGSFEWTIQTDLTDGIDYQIRISDVSNPATYDESPNFAITSVDIPGDAAIPSYNLYIVIGIMCVVSIILLKNRKKL